MLALLVKEMPVLVMLCLVLTLATKTAMTDVASSGAEEPAAMKVAPATSSARLRARERERERERVILSVRLL